MRNTGWKKRGRYRLLCYCLLACSLASLSCDISPEIQFTPVLDVHCLLRQGLDSPTLILDRTYSLDEPAGEDFPYFPGAEVRMWRGQDSWRLWQENWAYRGHILEAHQYDTFHLRVSHPDYDTVVGHTTVPDTFRILFPQNGDTVDAGDSLVWTRSRNCEGYYFSFVRERAIDTFYFSLLVPNESLPGQPYDTTKDWLPMLWLESEPEGPLTFRFLALDANYCDWIDAGGFQGGGQVSEHQFGITGGVGVFGSASICSVQVYVRHDTTAIAGLRGGFQTQTDDTRRCSRLRHSTGGSPQPQTADGTRAEQVDPAPPLHSTGATRRRR